MGKIDWNTFKERVQNTDNNRPTNINNGPSVGFFSLKNDGDEAVVRIMHTSPQDFEIVGVHPYDINGRTRNVSCIREAQDDVSACPLCAAGVPLRYKFYIHLIEYTQDSQGNIVATPKVWERASNYANKLANLCAEYGEPLYSNVFKIKRSGAAGSRETSYDILYANPSVYREDLYPVRFELFEGYSAIGRACFSYDFTGMQNLLAGGNNSGAPATSTPKPATPATPAAPAYSAPATSQVAYQPAPATPAAQLTPARTYTPSYNVPGNNYNTPAPANNIPRPVRNFR